MDFAKANLLQRQSHICMSDLHSFTISTLSLKAVETGDPQPSNIYHVEGEPSRVLTVRSILWEVHIQHEVIIIQLCSSWRLQVVQDVLRTVKTNR